MTTPKASLKTALTGYVNYRGREGHYSFLLHRLTGLGTLLFLIIHIVDTSFVYFFPDLYEHAIQIYRSTPFMIGEIGLVFSVVYHGINGLRIAIVDLYSPKSWTIPLERKSTKITLAASVLLWIVPAWIMLSKMLEHNFGIIIGG